MRTLFPILISLVLPALLAVGAPLAVLAAGDVPLAVGAAPVEVEVEPVAPVEPEMPTLEELRWVARPVVVFADNENDPRFVQQMEQLAVHTEDLVERDVVILVDTNDAELSPLRRELRPRDFTLVLIDKDGSVVQRRPTPTTVRELTRTIDRLPSRRQETNSRRQ